MRLSTGESRLLAIIAALFLTGCSVSGKDSVHSLGNDILELVGLVPGASVFSTAQSLSQVTKTMTREEEYYVGRAVAAQILSVYPLYENERLTAYVNLVGAAVVAHLERAETFGGYHFAVLDTDTVAALSAPGGFIFVTRGMMKILPDEDALASVLAHEAAHVERQHGLAAISQANMNELLKSTASMAASLNCGEVLQGTTQLLGGVAAEVTTVLLEKGYSRDQEREADAEAVRILYRAGYNPHALIAMLAVLENSGSGGEGGWMRAHPGAAERRVAVAELLERESIPALTEGKVERARRFGGISTAL